MKEANVEADLEDHIEREIEDEISQEILNLSQKLATLQAKLGAKRVKNGSMPAVMSCPVTPVLTPRDLKENIEEGSTQKSILGQVRVQLDTDEDEVWLQSFCSQELRKLQL